MYLGLTIGLSSLNLGAAGSGGPAGVIDALGARDGVAIDFVSRQMVINDSQTPANAYSGAPETKLTVHGSDPYLYHPEYGLSVDALRDFSIALSTTRFPFNPAACTVYIKYRLNTATSGAQRYLFMTDNAGVDRFAAYAVSGEGFRFVTGDGVAADIATTNFAPLADTEHRALFGADINGKTYVDDGGVQADTADTLATSTPTHVGIGGYPDRVLRVLDGHIAEVLILTEPVAKEDRLTLDLVAAPPPPQPTNPPADPFAFQVLGGRDGFAIDFVEGRMKINDRATPANAFDGDPEEKLTVFGSDPYAYDPALGLSIDAARDFSIALATDLFPYNPTALTVYAKYRLNAASLAEQRYLLMADNAGVDRFALYSVPGEPMRFVTGDGAAADIVVSDFAPVAGTDLRVAFATDGTGKSFVDDGGLQGESADTLAASTPAHLGIGGYNDRVLRVLDGHLAEIVVITETVPRSTRLTLPPFGAIYRAEGDSHTFNTNAIWGVQPAEFYPAILAGQLGANADWLNLGGSGDSTAEMVHQLPSVFAGANPDLATIYGGANDGAIDIVADTAPTETTFSVDAPYASRLEPGGFVIVNGETAEITARAGNLITIAPALTTAPVAGDVVEIDTTRNIEAWIDALTEAGCQRILVLGLHYMNFASGGDTPTSEHPTRAAIRAKQRAAALSRNMPYCDTYASMAAEVAAGDVVAGDDLAWHVDVGNTHLNAAGEAAVARAVIARMTELGWL